MLALIMPFSSYAALAQRTSRDDSSSSPSAALVSGAFRIEVRQTAVVNDPSTIGLELVGPIVAVVADVTNLGAATVFDPSTVTVDDYESSPLEIQSGSAGDLDASQKASMFTKLSIDGNFAVSENSTIRIMVVITGGSRDAEASLGLRMGDQVMSLDTTMVETIDTASITPVQSTMVLRIADVTAAPGSGKLTVVFRDGGSEDIVLSAVDTPKAGTGSVPGCFYAESSAAILAMSGGTVWLEQDGEGYLVWINNAALGTFDLMQARIVQEGFGGAQASSTSAYGSWLRSATDWAQNEGTGLWTDCKSAAGDWKVEPTPAPEPTKTPEEIRAQYQWIDARDLIIRPGTFEGQKIVVQGSVFNIQVEGNFTFMQIWVSGGNYDAVMIGYYGDSTGIYEGTWVTVYGEGAGTSSGTNAYGGTITQPLIQADIIDH